MTGLRVLLVDDEEELVSVLAERLEFRNIYAKPVYSGAEAVACVRNEEFHLALIDVKMPEMGGIETMKRIKEVQPLIRVILMTGHGDSGDEEEFFSQGAYDYVVKPISIDDLLAKIRGALEAPEQNGAEE